MMKKIFLHDTNALRELAEGLYYSQLIPTATELRKRLEKKDAENHMNVLATMELMRHFNESDPAYERCLKAMILQVHLTTNEKDDGSQSIEFIPPWNPLLTQHFFGKNSDFIKYYYRIMEIATNISKDEEPEDWKKDANTVKDISIIGAQLLHDRTEIRDNLEDFIKFINAGDVEWDMKGKKTLAKKKMREDIISGKMHVTMAIGLMRRAHAILELEFPQPEMQKKLDSFIQFYLPVLNMNTLLIQKFLNGFSSLQDPSNKAWNTLNDMQFLAGACFVSKREWNNDVRVIVVTNDKGIHEACKGTYMEGRIWTIGEYQAFVYN